MPSVASLAVQTVLGSGYLQVQVTVTAGCILIQVAQRQRPSEVLTVVWPGGCSQTVSRGL